MSTIDSPAIGTATINAVSVDCPAKTNLTLHVGPSHAEWGGRHELDTIYCAVGVYDTVTATRKAPGSGFSLNLEGAYLATWPLPAAICAATTPCWHCSPWPKRAAMNRMWR